MLSSKVPDLHSDPCHCTYLPEEEKAQGWAGSALGTSWHPLLFEVEKPSVLLLDAWNFRACHKDFYSVSLALILGASRQRSYHLVSPSNNSMINWKFYSDFWCFIHKSKTPNGLIEEGILGLWFSIALSQLSKKKPMPRDPENSQKPRGIRLHWFQRVTGCLLTALGDFTKMQIVLFFQKSNASLYCITQRSQPKKPPTVPHGADYSSLWEIRVCTI